MWLHASCSLEFNIPVPTPFLLMLRPRSGRQQWVAREQYVLSPSVSVVEFTDSFGNLCQRLVAPAGYFSVHTSVEIETADVSDMGPGANFVEVQQLPDETLPFLYPSRYCESDRFNEMAASLVAGQAAGYDQCTAIVDYIRNTVTYTPGEGQQIISASELNELGHGVCRDMAHLGIACCRALSIPARMVVGYLESLEPMDLHAWFEAYVGNRWYTFDPTQVGLQGGRVAIAFGRDAADVAIYTQFGDPVNQLNMQVNVERMAEPPF
ncbi:transglutaminase-like enzyme, putative cysteine protease [Desulfocapsa sulfexigens DSM 10523]|uniref:Transglutaminase-like enzyme, putative cysteine protease n=1 Tax=Desulfocapsa sulfexigens (strain DSM 10523 / SB164P1) TaxID=1167006 RepID=M1PSU5_DESSD|nr:transglutaminase family protein [Desulfocapsa sulfexigens]AGF79391.1 transglutaminase-like enzyme, putative cysteine protease [Desulfocapsa sulfexigens DSM 10523]